MIRLSHAIAEAVPDAVRVPHLEDIADALRDQALAMAQRELGAAHDATGHDQLAERPDFAGHFRLGLAAGIARVLADNDRRVLAVYAYEPAGPGEDAEGSTAARAAVHLLVVVTAPSAALAAFVASLGRALAASLGDSPAFRIAPGELTLDVNTVTEGEIRLGLGVAGLLSTAPAPPVKLWERRR